MKIAIFTDGYWPRIGGVNTSIDSFTYELLKREHEVMIVCPEYPEGLNKGISAS